MNGIRNAWRRIADRFRRIAAFFDRNYLARTLGYLFVSLLAVGLIFYFGYHMVGRLEPGLELVDAVTKTVATTVEADGYIMRCEMPVYAAYSYTGSVAAAVPDGGKVAVGGRLADVYSASAPEIENRIAEIDTQIAQLKKNDAEDRSAQTTTSLDAEIYAKFFSIASDCARGNCGDALARRVSLLVDMQKRAVVRGSASEYEGKIRALESERKSLTSQLGANLETVFAPRSGYYYAEYDGYGTIFSADQIADMNYDEFMALIDSDPSFGNTLCAGTLLTDFNWYVACPMTKTQAASLVDMYDCSVQFLTAAESFTMDLYRIIAQTPGEGAVVVLRCETVPQTFNFTRMQKVVISTVEYSGFELPVSALRVVDGYRGVYVQDGVTVRFRRVNVIHESEDGTVICTGNAQENEAIREDVRLANLRAGKSTRYDETSFGTYYWIEENDVVIVGGRDLYTGKIVR
ncbi:MAG: hypothetical protein IIU08_08535 [Clostridia bacterium]|nr:hypothetical protein [Clostridia bacterium]